MSCLKHKKEREKIRYLEFPGCLEGVSSVRLLASGHLVCVTSEGLRYQQGEDYGGVCVDLEPQTKTRQTFIQPHVVHLPAHSDAFSIFPAGLQLHYSSLEDYSHLQ